MGEETRNFSETNVSTSTWSSYSVVCFYFTEAYFERYGNSSTPYLITSVLNAVLSVAAFCGNGLILVAIWKATALHWPSKLLIFNLALTDFVIGLVVQPLFAAFTAKRATGFRDTSYCGVRLAFHLVASCLTAVSFLSVAAISLDRFAALRYHLRYREIVKAKRVAAIIVLIWLSSGTWSSTWIWKNHLYYPLVIAWLCLSLPVTTYVYVSIYRMFKRQERRVETELSDSSSFGRRTSNMRSRRAVTGMLYIYCTMLLCYLPYLCINLIIRFTGRTAYKQTILDLASTTVFANSSVNPIIYCWRLRSIRQAVRQTLGKMNVCNFAITRVTPINITDGSLRMKDHECRTE